MIQKEEEQIEKLKKNTSRIKKTIRELSSLSENLQQTSDLSEQRLITSQMESLKNSLRETNENIPLLLDKVYLIKPMESQLKEISLKKKAKKGHVPKISSRELKSMGKSFPKLEMETIKRLKKKDSKTKKQKKRKANKYVQMSNRVFSKFSMSIVDKGIFRGLKRDLIEADLQFIPANYLSVVFFTTLISIGVGFFLFLFFMFFNISPTLPIVSFARERLSIRFLKVFWLLFVVPIGTFLLMYFYPSMEKKSVGNSIEQELPFATIHMSAIAGSLIEPSKIFSIIISTREYPQLEKKFTKLINEINVYGYDLASAIRNMAFTSPSTKLSEMFNGIATTITSGGNLADFFGERAKSLLFEHRLEREKQIRSAETFMDLYISVVIAAPMILMLLLIMMKVSGLGIALSTAMITLIIIATVSVVNIVFITFLHLKQPKF